MNKYELEVIMSTHDTNNSGSVKQVKEYEVIANDLRIDGGVYIFVKNNRRVAYYPVSKTIIKEIISLS